MTTDWEKRYSFRLTEEDIEIKKFLDQVPNNKRSEMVRKMLRLAYTRMMEENKEKQDIQALQEEIEEMKETQKKQHDEILKRLENVYVDKKETDTEESKEVTEEMMSDSANALLSSFGMS